MTAILSHNPNDADRCHATGQPPTTKLDQTEMAQLTIRENAKMGRDADEVEPKGRAISREVAKLKKRVERLEKRSKVLEARIQARENAATLPWE